MRAHRLNECWLWIVCGGLVLAAGCANQANDLHQVDPPTDEVSPKADNFLKSAGADIANLPSKIVKDSKGGLGELSETSGYILEAAAPKTDWLKRIIEDSKESFLRPDNLSIMLLAGGASVAMHSSGADKKMAENFNKHSIFHGFTDESLNIIGHPWTQFGASALWYAISRKNQDEFNRKRAEAMIAALSVTGVATFGLKAIRDNESPNGKDWAWPSGHAASSFTVASMLDEFYGPKVGVPAYALASVITYRMLDTGDHWTSDVIFGAALGWVVGHTFGARHKQLEIAGFEVLPYTAYTAANNSTVVGVNLVKRF